VTGVAAIIAAVGLAIMPLCLCHRRLAAGKVAEIHAIFCSRHMIAAGNMNFMIAIGLGILVHIVRSHRTHSFLSHHFDVRGVSSA
jgi:NADH:ubiquinone oxidoreductase subunit K